MVNSSYGSLVGRQIGFVCVVHGEIIKDAPEARIPWMMIEIEWDAPRIRGAFQPTLVGRLSFYLRVWCSYEHGALVLVPSWCFVDISGVEGHAGKLRVPVAVISVSSALTLNPRSDIRTELNNMPTYRVDFLVGANFWLTTGLFIKLDVRFAAPAAVILGEVFDHASVLDRRDLHISTYLLQSVVIAGVAVRTLPSKCIWALHSVWWYILEEDNGFKKNGKHYI